MLKMDFVLNYIEKLRDDLYKLNPRKIQDITDILIEAYKKNKKIFIIGNGGSAASASHSMCDLGKGTVLNKNSKEKRFKVISLTDNIPLITAYGNDIGYEYIFSEQLKNLAMKGDILISISASGNSPNIIKAIGVSKKIGMINIGLSGFFGGELKELSDHCVHVQDDNYERVEDVHIAILHAIAYNLKKKMKCSP